MHLELVVRVGESDYNFIVTHFDGGSPASFHEPASMPEVSWELAHPELLEALEAEEGYSEESLWDKIYNAAEEALIEQAENAEADAADWDYK